MQRIEAEKLVEAWVSAVTRGAPGAFAELVVADVADISASGVARGVEPFEARTRAFHAAFADVSVVVDALVVEETHLAWRFTLRGEQRAAFMGVEPTGRRVAVQGVNFQRLEAGRVCEHWTLLDRFELLRQLRGT